jgi:formate dehydrogenase maturation protein FdhE
MVSADQRAVRARELAARYPHSAEVLEFYAKLVTCTAEGLRQLLIDHAPPPLAESAKENREPALSFISRARRAAASCTTHSPQTGVLRPEGDGTEFFLVCCDCRQEYSLPRDACPNCVNPAIAWYSNESLPHIQTRVCESCRRYLHVIHLGKDPYAIPEVDELVALPLDVWAREQGYEKLWPNLAGI